MLTPRLYFSLILFFLFSSIQDARALSTKYRCTWQDDPATSMVIGWHQQRGSQPVVYFDLVDWGSDRQNYAYQQSPDRVVQYRGMNNHFVRLKNLTPNTIYYFIIVDSEGSSKRMSFKTAPDLPSERLSIIAGGDSRNHRTARRAANLMVSKLRPHFVLFGGDMTGGDNTAQWRSWFDDWQNTIGSDGRLTPIIVARGNHEYSNETLINLFDIRSRGVYYALNFGGNLLRVYTLNSLIASGGDQKKWLAADLANYQDQIWKITQYHYPIRPHTRNKRERNGQLRHWASLFYDHQVNLSVESDAHVVKTTYPIRPSRAPGSDEGFIRDDERGTVFVGEGCWGAPIRRNNDDKKWTRNSGSFNQFKWIFVSEYGVEVRTIKTDNALQIKEVDPYDIFTAPSNLQIWQPSNGPVIEIPRRYPSTLPQSVFVSNSTKPMPTAEVVDLVATVTADKVVINWNARNEYHNRVNYQLQRSLDGENFQPIGEIPGQGKSVGNYYEIADAATINSSPTTKLAYRLKITNGYGQTSHFNAKVIGATALGWGEYEKIETDNNGLVKVQYKLQDASQKVHIFMVSPIEEEVTSSIYLNQKKGNYLKSIDMSHLPSGPYLLNIKSDQHLIGQYQIVK
ncbi:MAG: fibronectin type III domain-containing protein [Saprospiraceae bacterium]